MEVRSFLLTTVGFLGFLSGLLGFLAEAKKIVESDITRVTNTECVHSRSPSLILGIVAAIALLIAQIIANALGGCICCESRPNSTSQNNTRIVLAISFLTLSWVTFSIAFLLLLAGASINDRRDVSDTLSTGCYVLKSGVFTGAAFASLTTAVLAVVYNFQVISVRQGGSSALLASVGLNISEENKNGDDAPIIGKPIFPTDEQQTERTPDRNVGSQNLKRNTYTRPSLNNERGPRNLQMKDMSKAEIGHAHESADANGYQRERYPQSTRQSASAEHNAGQTTGSPAPQSHMLSPNTWMVHPEQHPQQTLPSPTIARQGGVGRVWEQSKYYQDTLKHA